MGKIQVFLDIDVIISALLSKQSASYKVIKNHKIIKTISNSVQEETKEVAKRLDINSSNIKQISKYIKTTPPNLTKGEVLRQYKKFVFDKEDSHIVAGADRTKSKFLLTHNIRHYKTDKIKAGLGIIVLKPGNFLQYLRSLGKF